MVSTKPYLLRAIYEWAEDNGFTPQVLVDANAPDVLVPREHVVEGQIILNIGSSAVKLHAMDNDGLKFSARFSGVEQNISLPIDSINAIFARENSQGIFFEEGDQPTLDPDPSKKLEKEDSAKPGNKGSKIGSKPPAKNKPSHLKIIK
ncbi:MAG TPA: ClpXP protease specificity-enhancing factor [Gammaproteobacteria bacterium]|nr:ClpXP protease specificity-enhancing factor [Gammaproteobacteria bacterium]